VKRGQCLSDRFVVPYTVIIDLPGKILPGFIRGSGAGRIRSRESPDRFVNAIKLLVTFLKVPALKEAVGLGVMQRHTSTRRGSGTSPKYPPRHVAAALPPIRLAMHLRHAHYLDQAAFGVDG